MCELEKVTFPVPQFPLEEDLPLWDFHCFAKAKYFELSVLRQLVEAKMNYDNAMSHRQTAP